MPERREMSEVGEFYHDKTLFITGGTGLMGKVLVEKLLYSCPGLNKIYLLIRSKRGKSAESRLDDILKIPLFERLRTERPQFVSQILPISGDVGLPGLGLSPEDVARLSAEVQIVVHSAATLRLEAKLKDAVNMNTEGTLRVVQLCTQMKQLMLMVHMSTAFCHCDLEVMEEKAYPPPHDPMDVIQLTRWLPDQILEKITPELLYPHPNSYTYSKRIAEAVVASHYPQIPACITRPSIVIPSWKEPVEGWVDNLNGPIGIMVGGGKGVIRSMHCFPDYNAEVIPVDVAINCIIAIIMRLCQQKIKPKDIPVFNITQGKTYPITWGRILDVGKECVYKDPYEMMLWYPNGSITTSKFLQHVYVLLFHWAPAYFIDFLLLIFGQKRLFSMDLEKINLKLYLTSSILGSRHYLLKENPASLPRCRRILSVLYVLDRFAHFSFYLFLGWLLVSCSDSAKSALDSVLSLVHALPFFRNIS